MSNDEYLIGQVARISVEIADLAAAAVDPVELRLKLKKPDDTPITLTVDAGIVKDDVGSYHADVALDAAGTWLYRWEGDAPNAGAVEGQLVVRKSKL